MNFLVFVSLCILGIVSSVFRSDREYRFIYNSQFMARIPSSINEYSGTRIQGLVSAVFQTEQTVILKVTRIRMGTLNQPLIDPTVLHPFTAFHEAFISQNVNSIFQAPVKFTYDNGVIKDVVFDAEDQPWSANIKRGIINLLKVDLKNRRHVISRAILQSIFQNTIKRGVRNQGNLKQSNDLFTQRKFRNNILNQFSVTEDSLDGECETTYRVVSEPQASRSGRFAIASVPLRVLNVTKTINLERCQKRPHAKYNFQPAPLVPCPPPACNNDVLRSSSVYRWNITVKTPIERNSFLIDQSSMESQYVFDAFIVEGNAIVTYVK